MVTDSGKITIANEVIATIAKIATEEVEGVQSTSTSILERAVGQLTGSMKYRGVEVESGDYETILDIKIVVRYGIKIQQVCCEDQR